MGSLKKPLLFIDEELGSRLAIMSRGKGELL